MSSILIHAVIRCYERSTFRPPNASMIRECWSFVCFLFCCCGIFHKQEKQDVENVEEVPLRDMSRATTGDGNQPSGTFTITSSASSPSETAQPTGTVEAAPTAASSIYSKEASRSVEETSHPPCLPSSEERAKAGPISADIGSSSATAKSPSKSPASPYGKTVVEGMKGPYPTIPVHPSTKTGIEFPPPALQPRSPARQPWYERSYYVGDRRVSGLDQFPYDTNVAPANDKSTSGSPPPTSLRTNRNLLSGQYRALSSEYQKTEQGDNRVDNDEDLRRLKAEQGRWPSGMTDSDVAMEDSEMS